jgi:hypothetical protein
VHDGMQEHIRSQILTFHVAVSHEVHLLQCASSLRSALLRLPAFRHNATAVASTLYEQHCAELIPCLMLLQHVLVLKTCLAA